MNSLRPLLIVCATAAAAASMPANAQQLDGDQTLEFAGRAAPACIIQSGATGTGSNARFVSTNPSRGEVRITQLVNPQTSTPLDMSMQIALPVICNSAHIVTVRSTNGGLARNGNRRNPVRNGGFIEFLPYRMSTAWLGISASAMSNEQSGLRVTTGNGGAGALSINLSIAAQNTPMIAGRYEDSVVIEVSAAN